ncbi:MAG: DsbA family oxidoreductase [Acidobacteria bacterium]|nr:DsbA family oxidoreductase [Acidobacteriota bacterium]
MRIDVWSDIVCPWCYIGKGRFERALAGFEHRDEVDIVHRSFQLDPVSARGTAHDHRDRLMFKYGMSRSEADATQIRMERTAAEEGLEFHLVGGVTGNTVDAHRLLCLARERGMQQVLLERLYRAHFTEQRSVFDPESLAVLAGEVGLDSEEAAGVLAGSTYADAVAADSREARELRIGGVPYYRIDDRHAVSGAQPPESFSRALTGAWLARTVSSGAS